MSVTDTPTRGLARLRQRVGPPAWRPSTARLRCNDRAAIYDAAQLRVIPEWNPFAAWPAFQSEADVEWLQSRPQSLTNGSNEPRELTGLTSPPLIPLVARAGTSTSLPARARLVLLAPAARRSVGPGRCPLSRPHEMLATATRWAQVRARSTAREPIEGVVVAPRTIGSLRQAGCAPH